MCDFFSVNSNDHWDSWLNEWKLNSSSCLKGRVQGFKTQNSADFLVCVQDRSFTMSPAGDIMGYNLSYLGWEVFL